jgi:hypothetical protein
VVQVYNIPQTGLQLIMVQAAVAVVEILAAPVEQIPAEQAQERGKGPMPHHLRVPAAAVEAVQVTFAAVGAQMVW